MAGIEQPIAVQPVIKDVATLKANIKEEKRARAEAGSDRAAEDNAHLAADTKAEPAGERRKRRKVSGTTATPVTALEPKQSDEQLDESVIDGPISTPSPAELPEKAIASTPSGINVAAAATNAFEDSVQPSATSAEVSSDSISAVDGEVENVGDAPFVEAVDDAPEPVILANEHNHQPQTLSGTETAEPATKGAEVAYPAAAS